MTDLTGQGEEPWRLVRRGKWWWGCGIDLLLNCR